MPNWGKKEHNWEGKSSWLIAATAGTVTLWWQVRWEWLLYVLTALIFITLFAHLLARFYHRLERRAYRRR